jgi:hypothetical protein
VVHFSASKGGNRDAFDPRYPPHHRGALPGVDLYQLCGQTEAGPGGIYSERLVVMAGLLLIVTEVATALSP